MTAWQVVPFPRHFTCGRIQTRRAKAAEMDVDPTRLDHCRRCGVRIHRRSVAKRFRVIAVKHVFIETNFACFSIHTNREEIVTVFGSCGQPDPTVHHHWRRPTAIWNFRFPLDIVRLAPMQGKADWFRVSGCRDMTIAPRATELRPVRSDCLSSQGEYDQREKSYHEVEVT